MAILPGSWWVGLSTPILSLCHSIFKDWTIFSPHFLLWNKGSSCAVTQWRQLVSCDWSWHSHGSLTTVTPGFHIVVSVVSVVRKKFIGQVEFIFYLVQQVVYVVSFLLSICTGGFHKAWFPYRCICRRKKILRTDITLWKPPVQMLWKLKNWKLKTLFILEDLELIRLLA